MSEFSRLVGFHLPSPITRYGDLSGILLGEINGAWYQVAGHISSNSSWSRIDMQYHADKHPGVPYEWLGELSIDEAESRFPAGADLIINPEHPLANSKEP